MNKTIFDSIHDARYVTRKFELDDHGCEVSLLNISSKSMQAKKKVYEIDFIGNGTLQTSQYNILNHRTHDISKDKFSMLSARGIQQRSSETFGREIKVKTNIIRNEMKLNLNRTIKSRVVPPAHLFESFFKRALAYDRTGQLDHAINDYSICATINPKNHLVYYNRACVYHAMFNKETDEDKKAELLRKTISDYNSSLHLDPSNLKYRDARSVALRNMGQYIGAVNDIMICRAAAEDDSVLTDLECGKNVKIDSSILKPIKREADELLTALRLPKDERNRENMTPVIDFLSSSKFTKKIHCNTDTELMYQVACEMLLINYQAGETVFEEGDLGKCLYIIIGGEISIVKTKIYRKNKINETLVKLYRGDSFGENALDGDGIRTAGAVATQPSQLLVLSEKDYKGVTTNYRKMLKQELLEVFSDMELFKTWKEVDLGALTMHVTVESYGPNYSVVKQGEVSKHFYILKQGMVRISKAIDKPPIPKITRESIKKVGYYDEKIEPGLWVRPRNWRDRCNDSIFHKSDSSDIKRNQEEYVCGTLVSRQYFGETSVLTPFEPSPVTVTTLTSAEIYKFPGEVLISLGIKMNKNSIGILDQLNALFNPSSEKLSFYSQQSYAWTAKKNSILETIARNRCTKSNTRLSPLSKFWSVDKVLF